MFLLLLMFFLLNLLLDLFALFCSFFSVLFFLMVIHCNVTFATETLFYSEHSECFNCLHF